MSLTAQIRETFEKATLQHIAAKRLNGGDWARYREIEAEHLGREREEKRAFHEEYEMRVEVARRQLIDQAAAKKRTFRPRLPGRDDFDKDTINRQAHRAVTSDHEWALSRLAAEKEEQIDLLLKSAQKRHDLGELVRQDFRAASDRRSGMDRRSGPAR